MKRIIICFDGTTNKLDTETPTNVLLTASCITPETTDGAKQVIHYAKGVGTNAGEKLRGALFGQGLYGKIQQAYEFLIFNYEPGDAVFVFGFSRGAFTARSFVGFVKHVGILERHNVHKIKEAIKLYKRRLKKLGQHMNKFRAENSAHICTSLEEDTWRCENIPNYKAGMAEQFQFQYVGVWDTVGSLGFWNVTRTFIPKLRDTSFKNAHYAFHDISLSNIAASARHAIALDERRRGFDVTPWGNLDALNVNVGFEPTSKEAPYQQNFFPGTHGSIGGGGFVRGLSDASLSWVWDGAKDAGLKFDTSPTSRIYESKPDYRVALHNSDPSKDAGMGARLPKKSRISRPEHLHEVHQSAINRWNHPTADELDGGQYRPDTLANLSTELGAAKSNTQIENKSIGGLIPYIVDKKDVLFHTVVRGDTLSKLAKKYLGDYNRYHEIFELNKGLVNDPNKIFVGQILKIPDIGKT
jgi:uncharacterized protein (DUF2235 family)